MFSSRRFTVRTCDVAVVGALLQALFHELQPKAAAEQQDYIKMAAHNDSIPCLHTGRMAQPWLAQLLSGKGPFPLPGHHVHRLPVSGRPACERRCQAWGCRQGVDE